ncbi:MAG: hypothetical protein ACXWWK_02265 [Gemmatimonadales bacterium]
MWIHHRLIPVLLGSTLIACGSDLTLPGEGSPAAILQVESGDGQQGTVGRRLANPLVVKLTNASSQPIEGVRVVFQFKSEVPEAEVEPEAVTRSDGRAFAGVRLGTSTGPHQIEARVESPAPLSTIFVVTAVERRGGGGGGGGGGDGDDDDDD